MADLDNEAESLLRATFWIGKKYQCYVQGLKITNQLQINYTLRT